MLSDQDCKLILNNFPKFELCYEIITHKKVYDSNVVMAIPEGNKCLVWFTTYKNNNVCFLLDIEYNDSINTRTNKLAKNTKIRIINTGFDDELSLALGTIFYGTFILDNNVSYFYTEDIYYYKGKTCNNLTYLNKLGLLKNIFEHELSQIPISNNYTIFGLPLMTDNLNSLLNSVQMLPHKISCFKFRYFESLKSKKINLMKYDTRNDTKTNNDTMTRNDIKTRNDVKINNDTMTRNDIYDKKQKHNRHFVLKAIFKITPDIEPDIYNLFIDKNGKEEYYDIAFISDYKTSVMMNNLFRNIKENNNLDSIEESDTEEEFEDNRDDKYVYLDRTFKMNCEYNPKFRRWFPVSLAGKTDKIISESNLSLLFRKKFI